MKKYICIILTVCMLFTVIPELLTDTACAQALESAPSRYASDAFCYAFENESDFQDPNVPIASSGGNPAENTVYSPGAGGSASALCIRQDASVYPFNGNISTGIKGLALTPGTTYKISVWIKVLSHENYQVAPNIHFFIMNNNTPLYSDAEATTSVSGSGIFDLITAYAVDFDFYENDGSVTGDWRKVEAYYTPDQTLGSYYISPGSKLYCNTFMRIGSSAHSICTPKDFTDAFIESITVPVTDPDTGAVTYEIDTAGYYTEYAVDDWSMEPYTAPLEQQSYSGVYNDFNSPSWKTASELTWQLVAANAAVTSDSTRESNVLHVSYLGNQYSYMDLSVLLDKQHTLLHNRAYHISFHIKGSEALTHYFRDKQKYLKLIPERTYPNRLERTIHKWAETPLLTKITEDWQEVSLLWYEPTPHMPGNNSENDSSVRLDLRVYGMPVPAGLITENIDGKDVTYAYKYQNKSDETVYANLSDFSYWIDDFRIEPADIVLNGDFAYQTAADTPFSTWKSTCYSKGTNPNLPTVFEAGIITEDSSVPAGKNALVLKKGDAVPGQKVEIDDNADYTLSFWAKADTPDSVGTHIFPVLDRSVHGPVRDSAVTATNPEGLTGYGNLTGETGDIPYYLYKGTMEQHNFSELNVKSGETLVYDDYFARMKSVNGYEAQAVPTAWNYQYYNGTEWISQNTDVFTAAGDTFALTSEWKKYTVSYRWNYEGKHYRLPRLSFFTDISADFRLADVSVEKTEYIPKDPIRIENFTCEYNNRSLYVGNVMELHYQYVSEEGFPAEGSSLVKLLIGDEKGDFAVSSLAYTKSGQSISWEIPDVQLGSRVGFEIIPIAEDGTFGVPQQLYTNSFVRGNVHSELVVDSESGLASFRINAVYAENVPPEGITAFLSLYDKNNRMIKLLAYPVEEGTFSESVSMGNAEKAKLIVMEGTDFMIPCCKSNSDICFPENTAPFADTDTITVAFLGGSSASGIGIHNTISSTYSTYVGEYLQDTYPNKEIQILRYTKDGNTTKDGLRIARDVLSVQPDLIFIDYTADDKNTHTESDLTTLIETLTSGEKVPYIIFLYSGDNKHTDFSVHYQAVAEQYKIPHIDLRMALSKHLGGADATREGYMLDSLHPSTEGHIVYATAIIEALAGGHCYSKIR